MLVLLSIVVVVLSFWYFVVLYLQLPSLKRNTSARGKLIKDEFVKRDESSVKATDLGVLDFLKIAWEFKGTLWDDIPPYERAASLNQRYGSLVRMFYNWSLTKRVIVVSDLKLVKQILCSSAWLNRCQDGENHYAHILGFNKPIGILLSQGPYWKEARRILMKLFRDHNMLDFSYVEGIYSAEIRPLLTQLHSWLSNSNNDHEDQQVIFSPERLFDTPVLNVTFKMLFGRRVNFDDPKEAGLADQMHCNNAQFTACLSSIEYFPFLKYFPQFTFLRDAMKLFNTIYAIVAEEAEKRRALGTYSTHSRDMLESMLKEVDDHEGKNPNYFTFECLQVTIRDLILAGADTTNIATQHFILYIATHPEKQRRVQAEIDQFLGPEKWPTYDDRIKMVYTQAVLLETLRFGCILPVTARTCTRDCVVGDLDVSEGTHCIPNYFGVHRSKELWSDPDVFRPERFINDKNEIVNTEKIIPFAYGPRACVGEIGGRVALFMFAVTLLREFMWELSDQHPPPSIKNMKGLTRPPAPYFVKLRRRIAAQVN